MKEEDLEKLRKWYEEDGITLTEIAERLGTTFRVVQRAKVKNGILKKGDEIKRDKDTLQKLVDQGLSTNDIGKKYGMHRNTIRHWLNKHNIRAKSYKDILTKDFLEEKYIKEKKSTITIGEMVGCSATNVETYLHKYGIKTRSKKGRGAEKAVVSKLENLGCEAEDMNATNPTSIYDVLVNGSVKIEVKSARLRKSDGYAQVQLLNLKKLKETDYRIRLKNGYTRKIFRKTCDFLVFVIFGQGYVDFYIVPSDFIDDKTQTLTFGPNGACQPKYNDFLNRWDLIVSKTRCANIGS